MTSAPDRLATASPSRGALALAFAAIYLIWGSTYLGIRIAIETMPPFLMAGARFTIAGGLLFGFLLAQGRKLPTAAQLRDNSIVGACLILGGNAVVSWAEVTVPSGITTLILGASPFVMIVLDWIRPGGSRPTLGLACGLGLGLVGLATLLGPGAFPAAARPPAASLFALFCSSICWWGGSLYSKHAKSGAEPLMAAAIQMLAGSLFIFITALAVGEGSRIDVAAISDRSWIAFGYLVTVGSLVAFPVYVWLLKHSTPARVSTYAYVNPVVAVILGWAVLNEPLNLRIGFAAAVIVAAVAIVTVQKTRVTT